MADIHFEPVGAIHGPDCVGEGCVVVVDIDAAPEEFPGGRLFTINGDEALGHLFQAVDAQLRVLCPDEEPAALVIFVALASCGIYRTVLTEEQQE